MADLLKGGAGGGGTGGVTQVNTGSGLTGGPITTTGTISVTGEFPVTVSTTASIAEMRLGNDTTGNQAVIWDDSLHTWWIDNYSDTLRFIHDVAALFSMDSSGTFFTGAGNSSTSSSTGDIVTTGGIGSGGAINAAGIITSNGVLSYTASAQQARIGVFGGAASALALDGGVHVWAIDYYPASTNLRFLYDGSVVFQLGPTGNFAINDATASTSSTTGALTVVGGIGCGGALNAGSYVTAADLGNAGPVPVTSVASQTRIGATAIQRAVVLDNGTTTWYFDDFSGTLRTVYNNATVVSSIASTGATQWPFYGAGAATFDASGNITSVSDERVKDFQRPFTRGINDLARMGAPVIFKYRPGNPQGLETEHEYAGYFAQDVQKAIPEAVGQGPDGYLTLSDRPILAAAINGLLDQQEQINELKARVAALEAKIS